MKSSPLNSWNLKLLVGLAICFVLVAAFARFRLDAPAPVVSAKAADSRFSAASGVKIVATLLAGNTPHPVDSTANDAVRERLVGLLRQYGYQPEVQDATSCREEFGFICARVKNITATLPGREPGQLIMLSAHYDSVRAGPGASDDISSVAVLLELARALKTLPPATHGVLFVFTDGEEAGTLGAKAFVRNNVLKQDIAADINLEARGTSGQSTLFETGIASGWLVRNFAESARRPSGNSTLSALYQLMPNDTDLTVFKSQGMHGLNFAFGENYGYYHTAHDDLDSLNLGSFQQQGDNAFDLVLRLRDEVFPPAQAADNLIYTDILGMGVVRWTNTTGWLLWLAALVGLGFAHRRIRSAVPNGDRGALRGFMLVFLTVFLAAAVAYVLTLILTLVAGGTPAWHTAQLPNRFVLWLSTLLVALAAQRRFARGAEPLGLWFGVGYAWVLLGLLTMIWLPGTSYLFVVPALVAAIVAIVFALVRPKVSELPWPVLLPALSAFILLLPIVFLIEIMLGFNTIVGVIAMAALVGLASTFVIPLLAASAPLRGLRYGIWAVVVVLIGSAVFSIGAPRFASTQPKTVNVLYIQNTPDEAYLVSSKTAATAAMIQSMGREASVRAVVPELNAKFLAVPVTSAKLSPARFSIVEQHPVANGTQLTLALDADVGTDGIELLFPKAMHLRSLETDGQRKDYATSANKGGDYDLFVCVGESCRSRTLTIVFADRSAQPIVIQRLAQLPAQADNLVKARNEGAVAQQDGDQAVIVDRIHL